MFPSLFYHYSSSLFSSLKGVCLQRHLLQWKWGGFVPFSCSQQPKGHFARGSASLRENWCTELGESSELQSFVADRHSLIEAKRGDLKTSWDGLDIKGEWVVYRWHGKALKEVGLEWDTEEEKKREWANLQAGIKSFHWQQPFKQWAKKPIQSFFLLQEILDKPAGQWSTGLRQKQKSTKDE